MFWKRLLNLIRLSLAEKKLFAEALFSGYWAKLYLLFVPYRRWSVKQGGNPENEHFDFDQILLIRKALQRARRFNPWKNRCLVMSMAGKHMLQRRGIPSELHLGLKHTAGQQLAAHAWLEVNGFEIIENEENYLKIASKV